MTRWIYLLLAFLSSMAGCGATARDAAQRTSEAPSEQPTQSTTASESPRRQPVADTAAAMRTLRQKALTTPPGDLGLQPNEEFPKVYGALAEFPMGDGETLTILSFRDGAASLYTTGSFGVIGGESHEQVRAAAMAFVRTAQEYYDEAEVTKEFPYPDQDRVRFYLLTFSGVRVIETDEASLVAGTNKYFALFAKGSAVLTELRKVTETKLAEPR